MPGSGAGLNRVGSLGGKIILTTSAASADSGAQMLEAKGFCDWMFTLEGTFTGYSVQLYGTIDPNTAGSNSGSNGAFVAGTASNWFLLPAPSVESAGDTAQWKNPLTDNTQALHVKAPLLAVRAVATGTGQTGTVSVRCLAVD